jgi:phosphoribosylamine--glycine ligase
MMACVSGTLTSDMVRIKPEYTMGVVIASEGYPGPYPKGRVITGIEEAEKIEGLKVFQAGTALADGTCTTSGGRVLCVTALGSDLAEAKDKAYQGVARIHFDGMYFRRDIGEKGLRRNDA